MCIAVFMWQAHPLYPFLLLLNRDEYYTRPTKPLEWWEGGEILGGRDEMAGGTWLACSRDGKVAFLTNFRELQSIPQAQSRGDLPVRFLKVLTLDSYSCKCARNISLIVVHHRHFRSKKNPTDFAEEFVKEAHQYNGFNLILTDIQSKTMVYITNRPEEGKSFVTEVSPGIHVLTNARLDSPWPKAQRLGNNFRELLDKYGEGELPTKEMVEKLMRDTTKDEHGLLPGIFPPEREYNTSSIFIDTESPLGRYGTRSTSALFVKTTGEVDFYEKHLEKDSWEEETVTFFIEKR
ncbi:hypothetical protein JRO89_XS02G0004900 [Xanthoceras sorbifolium]|uniref:Transport and Golgi organization protein 2 homolog n=1 Tax=Xanthoceras sorbifolium TaxID=99658 RepID=A0ABQ8IDN9_9ROSI|nr:hypothetical protein JRO89_XS02G0004900 [Xanthoceras sorbifolium]